MQPSAPGVFIVVRAFNEARFIGSTLDALLERWPEVIVVDDGSTDDTARIALERPVWVLRHAFNCGSGTALQTGLEFALRLGARAIVSFDSDGQHDVTEIERVLEPVLTGRAQVVLGSRFLGRTERMPWTRWLVLKAAVLFTRLVSRVRITDAHNGFRAFSAEAARRIRLTQPRMAYASELVDQLQAHRLSFCEVPVTIRYSAQTLAKGQSSWNALRIVYDLLLARLLR